MSAALVTEMLGLLDASQQEAPGEALRLACRLSSLAEQLCAAGELVLLDEFLRWAARLGGGVPSS